MSIAHFTLSQDALHTQFQRLEIHSQAHSRDNELFSRSRLHQAPHLIWLKYDFLIYIVPWHHEDAWLAHLGLVWSWGVNPLAAEKR